MRSNKIYRAILVVATIGITLSTVSYVDAQGIGIRRFEELQLPTKATVARGELVFDRQCATCHGQKARGGSATGEKFKPPAQGFVGTVLARGAGTVQLYNFMSRQQADVVHPVFDAVPYQDRWAVAHYVRKVNATNAQDPGPVMKQAEFDAKNGVCDDSVKSTVTAKVTPKGAEQIEKGKQVFTTMCTSCHGATGAGDGAAAAVLKPPPRDFTKGEGWTNGTSALAVFNTVATGVEGTSMASYSTLPEEDRWALTHYIRSLIPAAGRQNATSAEIDAVCRTLSAGGPSEPISLADATRFLIEEAADRRQMKVLRYGPVRLEKSADPASGEGTYEANCSGCHGQKGAGSERGPYGSFPPFLYLTIEKLAPGLAGGTVQQFAGRTIGGAHATLPDMSSVETLSLSGWRNLQAYVATFDGEGEISFGMPVAPPAPVPAAAAAPTDGGSVKAPAVAKPPAKPTPVAKPPVAKPAPATPPKPATN